MLIGTMNHPGRDLLKEIQWMAEMGFGFLDLTLEPPMAAATGIDVPATRAALEKYGLQATGHTAYCLPLGTGTLDLDWHVRRLQGLGYDGTITLEVFAPDRRYLACSRDILRLAWDRCAAAKTAHAKAMA